MKEPYGEGLAGVYCELSRQIPKSFFLCDLSRLVGITHGR